MNFLEKIKIEKFTTHDEKEVKELIKNIHSKIYFNETNIYIYNNLMYKLFFNGYDFILDYSLKIIYRKKIIGVMLLSDFSFYWLLEAHKEDNKNISKNIRKYKNKEGLRSVFFGVDIKYQKMGIGSKMIEYVRENYKQFDFLWGVQHKDISNLDFFLKRRKVVAEIDDAVYTVQDLR
jgi:hypothetical protein